MHHKSGCFHCSSVGGRRKEEGKVSDSDERARVLGEGREG